MIRFTKRVIIFTILLCGILFAQNTPPVVTNVDFTMRNDGSKIVDITYDVNDVDGQSMTVTIAASSDGGANWNLPITQVTGAVGIGITNGTGKTIVWNAGAELPNFYSATVQIRITADDGIVPIPTCPGVPSVIYEGKTYNTVQIGNQCWLRENLDVGTMIQGGQVQINNGIIEKYCPNNDINNCNIYGGLYRWDEAMQYLTTSGTQGICPPGWHIPTYQEMLTLGSIAGNGNALKEVGQGSEVGAGTNTSGFSALLAGIIYYTPYYFGSRAFFWTSSNVSETRANDLELRSNHQSYLLSDHDKGYGSSVRCIKD